MEQEEQTENKSGEKREEREEATEESFLKELYFFMKQRDTPIERIPHLGFKQIDLYLMYKTVKDLGGYHQVTAQQLWKKVYNILGGNPRSTSAATCTRRHYEKLLLPYEYHLAGYGDELPITPPRKHKLSHSFDEQYLLGPKRPVIRHVLYNQPIQHEFLSEGRLRTIPIPVSAQQYLHPMPSSLPNLFSVPRPIPSIPHLSPPFHTRIPVSYPPASSFDTESFKDPLKFLRDLADEYKSQPLNLSNRKGSLETSRDTPSSFSPLSNKKRPQFLNAPLPIYTKGDQPAAAAAAAPPRMEPPAQAVVNPMSMDGSHAINLTSSPESSPTLKKPSTPTATPTAPIPHRPSYPSASSAFPNKHPEQNPHSTKAGPYEKPQPSSSQAPSRPTLDSYGGMEIQIPLYLLQNWIKEGLISSLVSTHHHPSGGPPNEPNKTPTPEHLSRARMASESSEGPTSGETSIRQHPSGGFPNEPNKTPTPEPPSRGRISSDSSEGPSSGLASSICQQPPRAVLQESTPSPKAPSPPSSFSWGKTHSSSESSASPASDLPADLSMKSHLREPVHPKHDSGSTSAPMTINESQPPTIPATNRFASVKPFITSASARMPFSRDPYPRLSHFKYSPAEEQEACLKRVSNSKQAANTWSKDSTSPKPPPGYSADLTPSLAARLGKALEKVQMTKRNSCSSSSSSSSSSPLIQLTPEQLKLLLSSSALRPERGKIC